MSDWLGFNINKEWLEENISWKDFDFFFLLWKKIVDFHNIAIVVFALSSTSSCTHAVPPLWINLYYAQIKHDALLLRPTIIFSRYS